MATFTVGKNLSGQKSIPPLKSDPKSIMARLNAARDAFWFSVAGYALLTREPTKSAISEFSVILSNKEINVVDQNEKGYTPGVHAHRVNFQDFLSESAAREVLEKSQGTMISESLSIVEEFAKANKLIGEMHRQDWHKFATHYRNACSHGNKWFFKSAKGWPVTWRNMTLEHRMHGQSTIGFLGWVDGLQLGSQMTMFVQDSNSSTS